MRKQDVFEMVSDGCYSGPEGTVVRLLSSRSLDMVLVFRMRLIFSNHFADSVLSLCDWLL